MVICDSAGGLGCVVSTSEWSSVQCWGAGVRGQRGQRARRTVARGSATGHDTATLPSPEVKERLVNS